MLNRWLGALLLSWGLFSSGAASAGTVLVMGDSLSAAYGLASKDGWVALLEERLRREKFDYNVANLSLSGETSAGGAARIGAALKQAKPNVVVIALGSNDGLRGLPVEQMKQNLAKMIRAAQAAKARVLLIGARVPPNYGPQYTQAFFTSFAALAKEYKTAYVPFLLDGVALRRDLLQPDNLHPTAEAQPMILDTVWKGLAPLLEHAASHAGGSSHRK